MSEIEDAKAAYMRLMLSDDEMTPASNAAIRSIDGWYAYRTGWLDRAALAAARDAASEES